MKKTLTINGTNAYGSEYAKTYAVSKEVEVTDTIQYGYIDVKTSVLSRIKNEFFPEAKGLVIYADTKKSQSIDNLENGWTTINF